MWFVLKVAFLAMLYIYFLLDSTFKAEIIWKALLYFRY